MPEYYVKNCPKKDRHGGHFWRRQAELIVHACPGRRRDGSSAMAGRIPMPDTGTVWVFDADGRSWAE